MWFYSVSTKPRSTPGLKEDLSLSSEVKCGEYMYLIKWPWVQWFEKCLKSLLIVFIGRITAVFDNPHIVHRMFAAIQ